MQASDAEKFRQGIAAVMSFYGKDVAPFAFDIWWNILKPYELSAISEAFNRHLANPDSGQFAPKPADIIRMLQGSTQDSALRAWAKVDMAVRQIGPYCSVAFDDALIHRVIQDMGGWIGLSQRNETEWPFVAKEFENRYRGYKAKNEKFPYPPFLIGIYEADNSKNGFRESSSGPVLIGERQAAERVLNGGSDQPALQLRRVG